MKKLDLEARLEQGRYSLKICYPFKGAKKYGYNSQVIIVAPTPKFLRKFADIIETEIWDKKIKISYLEITNDRLFKTEKRAMTFSIKKMNTLRKKYTSKLFVFENTGYFPFKGKFQFVIYPRLSKLKPFWCCHTEWRMTGASLIKKKTGISTVRDFLKFDKMKFFQDQSRRQLATKETIDEFKLGKWLNGWRQLKKLMRTKYSKFMIEPKYILTDITFYLQLNL